MEYFALISRVIVSQLLLNNNSSNNNSRTFFISRNWYGARRFNDVLIVDIRGKLPRDCNWIRANSGTRILDSGRSHAIVVFEHLRRYGAIFGRSLCAQLRFRTASMGKPQLSRIPFPDTTGMPRGNLLPYAASLRHRRSFYRFSSRPTLPVQSVLFLRRAHSNKCREICFSSH